MLILLVYFELVVKIDEADGYLILELDNNMSRMGLHCLFVGTVVVGVQVIINFSLLSVIVVVCGYVYASVIA